MIVSRAPFRMSFAGGATDIRSFYEREDGIVVSATLDKYFYIILHKSFDNNYILHYSKTEIVDSVDKINNPIFRECIKKVGVSDSLEITSIADVPNGTGLGSSSSLTCALLKALYKYKGIDADNEKIAKEACEIEIEILKSPIGKQDQYAAAIGGFNCFRFKKDESVEINKINLSDETINDLNEHLLLLWTGKKRNANKILSEILSEPSPKISPNTSSETLSKTLPEKKDKKEENIERLIIVKKLAEDFYKNFKEGDFSKLGRILDKTWREKVKLNDGISNEIINEEYEKALKNGAIGGKILGAGGGGFLLLYIDKDKREEIIKNSVFEEFNFGFSDTGTEIVFSN